jgi:hypothetical protein
MHEDRDVSEPMDDAEFEAYIDRRSRLSHRYRDLTVESPPKELDEAVLSLARAAHSLTRPENPEREVYLGWMAPVAFAATVVLVFSVVLQIVIRPQLVENSGGETDRRSAPASAAAERFASERQESASPSAHANARVPSDPIEHRVASDTVSTPPAITAVDDAKDAAPRPPRRADSLARLDARTMLRPEAKLVGESEAATEPLASAASAAGNLATGERTSVAAPKADTGDDKRDPKAWLAEIERLRQSGQITAADEQMKRFFAQYPDYFRTHSPPSDAR